MNITFRTREHARKRCNDPVITNVYYYFNVCMCGNTTIYNILPVYYVCFAQTQEYRGGGGA